MRRVVNGSVMNEMILISTPQTGHRSGSGPWSWESFFAEPEPPFSITRLVVALVSIGPGFPIAWTCGGVASSLGAGTRHEVSTPMAHRWHTG
jgi:hypothetical protein